LELSKVIKNCFGTMVSQKGGVVASRMNPNGHSGKLVKVKYKDHVLFQNSDPKLYFDVDIREAVGWVILESDEFLCISNDRSVNPLPNEARESGFSIIKSDVIERKEIN